MLNAYRKLLRAIRCDDPWDWEADSDDDEAAAFPTSSTRTQRGQLESPAA